MQRQLLINLKYGNVFGITSVWNYLRVCCLRKYCEVRLNLIIQLISTMSYFKNKKHFHLVSSLSVLLFKGKKVSIKMAHI